MPSLSRDRRVVTALSLVALVIACGLDGSTSTRNATYAAAMTGTQELPRATGSSSTGSATVTVEGATATFRVTVSGFATVVTAAHIHIGAPGSVGPVIVPLPVTAQSGLLSTGTIDLSRPITFNTITISGDSLRSLLDLGRSYVNVHTAAWPDGEIRGQLTRQ